jgi:hypothetical protein
MMLKKILIVLLLAGLGYADDIDKGAEAFGKNDFETAVKLFSKACDGGNAKGCFNLGFMYENGRGVRQDYEQALKYFGKACDMDNTNACDA